MAPKLDRKVAIKWWLIGRLGKGLVNLICKTMKIKRVGYEKARAEVESHRLIFAFWHSRILLISYLYQGWGAATLVSSSNDGEMAARILHQQGHETIRGSSSRHGVRALAKMIRVLKKEIRLGAVVPDGPRGPRFKVQPGIITLAQKTKYPIVPISYSAKRVKIFNSWDRFILPFPFGEATVIYGEPLWIPAKLDATLRESYRKTLEEEMNRITREVDLLYGHGID